jgi:hypothetical protein
LKKRLEYAKQIKDAIIPSVLATWKKMDRLFSMRIDCCRSYGNELTVVKLCEDCDQPLHYLCVNCKHFVDDPIHSHGNILMN